MAQVITANLLIPGRGDPIRNGAIVFKDGKILYAGTQGSLPSEYSSCKTTHVACLLPGLWDSHVHFLGSRMMALEAFATTPQALAGARSARDVQQTLLAGFTSVREVAGYGAELAQAIAEGTLVGPNIYSSVSVISQTAGHGDAHGLPLEQVKDACLRGLPLCVADGVDECLKAVRLQIRRGAKLIKVCASGGVVSEIDNPLHQQFSDEELKAMVQEAARAKRIVAAHCHGKDGIMAALRAGCKTIEHGSYLDDECLGLMKKNQVMLVATRSIIEAALEHKEALNPESYRKLKQIADVHLKAYKLAVKSGVRIALGTDLGLSVPNISLSHGKNGKELAYAVQAGMTPLQAIEACTASAPATLGP